MDKKMQVFVSSTYTDLIEERQAAVQAILDAGHIPAGMELFKAGKSQLETIKRWIDESDIYILILGGRYGSIEEESGLSYTELEYKYALSKNMPVFAVVLNETFLTHKIETLGLANTIEQKSADKYHVFKSLVMSKIIKEVDDCKDIKIAIHTTLNYFIDNYNLSGWIRVDSLKTKIIINKPIYAFEINETTTLKSDNNLSHDHINVNLNMQNDDQPFSELFSNFRNTSFIDYKLNEEKRPFSKKPDALNIFIQNYNQFCSGVKLFYSSDGNGEILYQKICPYFEKFGILEKNKDNKLKFQITELGKSFYNYLKKRNYV